MAAKIPITTTTIINSSNVNPVILDLMISPNLCTLNIFPAESSVYVIPIAGNIYRMNGRVIVNEVEQAFSNFNDSLIFA